jgi:hypothetical protein
MRFRVSLVLAAVALAVSPAAAVTVDFEEFTPSVDHGRIVTSSQGVGISATNLSYGPDYAVVFDSNLLGTEDEDLQLISPSIPGGENGWATGNLAPDTDLGFLLIIQENDWGCGDGVCNVPDDEGSRPAGSLEFDFSAVEGGLFASLQFDIVDLESTTAEEGGIEFFLGLSSVGSISFSALAAMGGVTFGDNSANTMPAVDVASFGVSTFFDRAVFHLGGSQALDNIVAKPVPEPGAALVFALGLGIVGSAIRRRR